jgi:hypothetical protein
MAGLKYVEAELGPEARALKPPDPRLDPMSSKTGDASHIEVVATMMALIALPTTSRDRVRFHETPPPTEHLPPGSTLAQRRSTLRAILLLYRGTCFSNQ